MIDLHTHFLPGIDDGAKSVEEAAEMMKSAYSQGVTRCAATPHCVLKCNEDIDEFLKRRQAAYETFAAYTDGFRHIPIIYQGAEVYLNGDLKNFKDIGRLCIEGTDYILVEFPRGIINSNVAEWLYNLTTIGLKPILAHVDRYDQKAVEELEIFELDIVFQINAERLLSLGGRRAVKRLLTYDRRFVVSSDMHNMTTRPCNMGEAREKSRRKFDAGVTEELFEKNGAQILNIV